MRNNQALGQTSIIVSGRRPGRVRVSLRFCTGESWLPSGRRPSAVPSRNGVIFNWARLALAGGVAGFALFFALTPSVPTPEERAGLPIGEWIATAAHSDQQVASLISDKVLNEWMTQPYQQQLDSISGELENALDFTLRLVPIKIAQR